MVECMTSYLVNGAINSINAYDIKPMLKQGLNTIKIKLSHNDKIEVTRVSSSSGNRKLDVIFEDTIEEY